MAVLLATSTFMTLHEYASSFYICFVIQHEIGSHKIELKLISVDGVYYLDILNYRLLS